MAALSDSEDSDRSLASADSTRPRAHQVAALSEAPLGRDLLPTLISDDQHEAAVSLRRSGDTPTPTPTVAFGTRHPSSRVATRPLAPTSASHCDRFFVGPASTTFLSRHPAQVPARFISERHMGAWVWTPWERKNPNKSPNKATTPLGIDEVNSQEESTLKNLFLEKLYPHDSLDLRGLHVKADATLEELKKTNALVKDLKTKKWGSLTVFGKQIDVQGLLSTIAGLFFGGGGAAGGGA